MDNFPLQRPSPLFEFACVPLKINLYGTPCFSSLHTQSQYRAFQFHFTDIVVVSVGDCSLSAGGALVCDMQNSKARIEAEYCCHKWCDWKWRRNRPNGTRNEWAVASGGTPALLLRTVRVRMRRRALPECLLGAHRRGQRASPHTYSAPPHRSCTHAVRDAWRRRLPASAV